MLEQVNETLEDWYIEIVFLLGAIGTSSSLYVSQILNWEICGLCWFQRVLMYPIPLIVGSAILTENRKISYSILPLSVIGSAVSLYHYLSIALDPTRTCGFILPCSLGSQLFIGTSLQPRTLPLAGFIAFTLISVIIWRYEK